MKKTAASSPPADTPPSPLDAVVAAMQRSMETALNEQREHGRLLRQIVAETTKALLAEPVVPEGLAPHVAANVEKIKRATAQHQQRAAALAASIQNQMDAMRKQATVPAPATAARPAKKKG